MRVVPFPAKLSTQSVVYKVQYSFKTLIEMQTSTIYNPLLASLSLLVRKVKR
jgi:hypothetical protein